MKKIALVALLLAGGAGMALASSYDDLNAGIQYYNLGQWQPAIGAFDKALAAGDLGPDLQFVAHFDRGQSYARIGRPDAAIEDYSASLQIRPGEVQVLIDRASAYVNSGKLDLAAADLDHVIAARPNIRRVFAIRIAINIRRGQWDKARDDTKMLLKLMPDNARRGIGIGTLDWEAGQITDAEENFSYEASNGPNKVYAWLWYALTEARLGKSVPRRSLPDADLTKWPGPVINFFLGTADREAVFASAAQADTPAAITGQLCEANLYVGEWLLRNHDQAGARPLIAKAATICPTNFIEWVPAQMDQAEAP
jgi:lipoprotein NlpI